MPRKKKLSWRKTTRAPYTRPSGHRSEGFWLGLSAPFGFLEQHTRTQTHNATKHNRDAGLARLPLQDPHWQSELSSACKCLDWRGEWNIFFPVIVFFYALAPGSLLSYAGRGWADEDARLRQWPRGRMRRWRASSAWTSLCHLLWSGHWLLLPQHSGWSLPVLTSAVAFVGGGDLFECNPTPIILPSLEYISGRLSRLFFFFQITNVHNLSLLGHVKA